MHLVQYISMFALQVLELDMGGTVPVIRNLRAMPAPNSSIWPQMLFEIEYEGDISLVLETKVDIKEGAAWGQFESAISRFTDGPLSAAAGVADRLHASAGNSDDELSDSGELNTHNMYLLVLILPNTTS